MSVATAALEEKDEAGTTATVFREQTLAAADGSEDVPPLQVARLFELCRVGEERILAEAGGDRFTQTLGRGVATATSALQSGRSGLKLLKPFTVPLRGFALSLYALILAAGRKGKVAWALSMLILTSGGALVVIASLGPTSFHLAGVVGAAIIAAGLMVMTIKLLKPRIFAPRIIATILLIAGISLAIAVVPPFLIQQHKVAGATGTDIRWLFLVLGVATGTTIIGSMTSRASARFVVLGAITSLGGLVGLWFWLHLRLSHAIAAIVGLAVGMVVMSAFGIVRGEEPAPSGSEEAG